MVVKAVCFDLGDTLMKEESVIRDAEGWAVRADMIEGALSLLRNLKEAGYKLAIICNASGRSARNVLRSSRLESFFQAILISGEMGVEKPDGRIFQAALEKLEVKPEEAVMVGNRISSDIVGANRVGMKSILFKWNNRYPDKVEANEERPDFTIERLEELPDILHRLDR